MKNKTIAQLSFALADINATLAQWAGMVTNYTLRLEDERQEIITEMASRRVLC